MGLDVTAYRKLTKLDALFNEDGEAVDPTTREPVDEYMRVRENHDFPGRAAGLEDGAAYGYEDAEAFWSGGYSRYNHWREQLAELAEYPLHPYTMYGNTSMRRDAAAWAGKCEGMPFVELVNFSDCEGTIGPAVSAKLARDFAEWTERAERRGGDFYTNFMEWRRCFEFAADGGAVCFHSCLTLKLSRAPARATRLERPVRRGSEARRAEHADIHRKAADAEAVAEDTRHPRIC